MSKEIRMTKSEIERQIRFSARHNSGFGFRHSLDIRHQAFVIYS